jgi:hypothetical protein
LGDARASEPVVSVLCVVWHPAAATAIIPMIAAEARSRGKPDLNGGISIAADTASFAAEAGDNPPATIDQQ